MKRRPRRDAAGGESPLTLSAIDPQFLSARQIQLARICRIFRVPPRLLVSPHHPTPESEA